MDRRAILNRILQLAIIATLAYFIVPVIVESFRRFDPGQWRINWWLMATSLLLMQVVLFAQSAIWSTIISFFGKKVSYTKAFRIAYLAQLGRYIPGKIWQLFGMIYLAGKEGVSKEEATTSFILSQLFATPPGIVIVVVYLYLIEGGEKYHSYIGLAWAGGVAVTAFAVVFFTPGLFKRIVNFAVRLVRQSPVEFALEKKVGGRVLISYFLTWNLYGVCFYLFLLALLPEHSVSVIEIIGAWTLAYLVGYWTIILPAGIGAREAALLVLLSPIIGAERAGILVVGARLWSLIGEVICTALAWRVR